MEAIISCDTVYLHVLVPSLVHLRLWILRQQDEEQADSAARATGSSLWMPHCIYGCLKCLVRSFHRKSFLGAIKQEKVTVIGPLPVMAADFSQRRRRKKSTRLLLLLLSVAQIYKDLLAKLFICICIVSIGSFPG